MSERDDDKLGPAKELPFDPQSIKRSFARVIDPLAKVVEATRRGISAETLEANLRTIPDDIGDQIIAARDAALDQLARQRAARSEAFGRWLTEFIQGCRRDGIAVREAEGWRIDRVEFELRREMAQARVRYNGETILAWTGVSSPDDLRDLLKEADAKLDARALAPDVLSEALWSAYRRCVVADGATRSRIPIRDLHRELRVELFRRDLRGRPDRVVKVVDMPTWAFYFNLDRYRELGAGVPANQRLLFETGSQEETKRLGVRLNGLRADEEYRSFCFVRSSSTTA